MRFMVIVKATPESEAGQMPSEEVLTAMTAFNEQLAAAGVLVGGDGLHPTSAGAEVVFQADGATRVDHGPLAGPRIAGYWVLECPSLEECVAWARRCPRDPNVESGLEIRQVFTAEDFGPELTPELRERESALRERLPA